MQQLKRYLFKLIKNIQQQKIETKERKKSLQYKAIENNRNQ